MVSVLIPFESSVRESTADPRIGGDTRLVICDSMRHTIARITLIFSLLFFLGHKKGNKR